MERIWVKAKASDVRASEWALRIVRYLEGKGINVFVDPVLAYAAKGKVVPESLIQGMDLAIVIGGDGTLLRVVQKSRGNLPPLLGFCIGSMGYLYNYSVEDFKPVLDRVLCEEYKIDEACIGGFSWGSLEGIFLNEVEILGPPGKVIEFKVFVDEEEVYRMRGDGVIVATAVGSTGHALSYGGPIIMDWSLNVLSVVPIAPLSPMARPLVVEGTRKVSIEVFKRPALSALLVIDGQQKIEVESRGRLDAVGCVKKLKIVKVNGRRKLHDRLRLRLIDIFM